MPPKVKITKNEIIEKALELLKERGEEALNARTLAATLGSSTQPIFSNFETMGALRAAVSNAAYDYYLTFLKREEKLGKYPRYKSFGMAYIHFAKEEKQLFKFLFMCDRNGEDIKPGEDFNESVKIIMNANGFTQETAELFHLEMWAFVHGIAAMSATTFLELDEELISRMITDVYQGALRIHSEGKDGSN